MAATKKRPNPGATRWLIEPARPEWVRERPRAHYYAVGAVSVGAFMGQLDASIVTVAFPSLERSFHTDVGAITWVGLSYLIVLVGGVTVVGRLGDMVGRKLLYTYGFVVFTLGSALCAVAPSLPVLDLFRVVQALGAVMLQANSVAIIYLALPPGRVYRGIGLQGAAQALGLALGPAVGGLLLAAGGWRLIFLVNVPVGLVGTVAASLFVPRSRELGARTPIDWFGLALFLPAVAALLVALSFGPRWGWPSPATVLLLVGAALGGTVFVAFERRSPTPMLDLALFRTRAFSVSVTSGMLSYLVLFGTMVAVPFFLERSLRVGTAEAGLVLSALPLALGVVAPVSGVVAERVGSRLPSLAGMLVVAFGLLAIGVTRPSPGPLAVGLAGIGAGLGLFTPANNAALMSAAPRAQAGLASGVLNLTRGLGTSLGLAVTGLVLATSGPNARAGFEWAGITLAAVALASSAVAASRGRTPTASEGIAAEPVG